MTKTNPMWALVLVVAVLGLAHLGLEVFRAAPAEAQTRGGTFRECFFARQESVDVDNESRVDQPGANRRIRVPSGWSVVGGGGHAGIPNILFCR